MKKIRTLMTLAIAFIIPVMLVTGCTGTWGEEWVSGASTMLEIRGSQVRIHRNLSGWGGADGWVQLTFEWDEADRMVFTKLEEEILRAEIATNSIPRARTEFNAARIRRNEDRNIITAEWTTTNNQGVLNAQPARTVQMAKR
jgi:hypothetical protein